MLLAILPASAAEIQREGNPTQTTSPEPKGPPKLTINYILDRENPDIAKIDQGKF